MSTTFITGDRSMAIIYPGQVLLEMVRALGRGDTLMTGNNSGIEEIVRKFAEVTDVYVSVMESGVTSGGYPDWDARAKVIAESGMSVVVVHADPHASRTTASLLTHVPEARLRLVTPIEAL